ncbi:hypothetical protein OOZ15_03515 [Galbibacter sp. EGI 63066]|uniref:hypothetical protein n=1 Tax=Galbibacter sp. EGI 63066 TaxID=2993559 RepID=UPI00224897CE|nr:hypothetical protein [Galbibacter sp. EGI 63066]MCX2678999.1 hypothetical protein [Galbibacter sp. EGI 63066]
MAKQKSIVKFTGTIDGINFYYRKGVPVARKAGGGFNKETIKKSPKMERVRENNSEFGLCSRTKKVFKDSLYPFLMYYKDPTLHGRMMKVFQQIKTCDTVSERGKRTVGKGLKTDKGKQLLKDFSFTPKRDIETTLMGDIIFDRESYKCQISGFDIKQFKFHPNATHFELLFGIIRIDFDALGSKTYMATPVIIGKGFNDNHIELVPEDTLETGGMKFAFLGIRFYQEVSGNPDVLKAESATGIKLLDVFFIVNFFILL